MVDVAWARLLLATLIGCLDHRQQRALAFLIEENRILRRNCVGGAFG